MIFHILTLFPEMVRQGLETSIIGRAVERELIQLHMVNIRDHSTEKHGKVDDYTYGGGAGMLMQAQPVFDAWKSVSGMTENIREDIGTSDVGLSDAEAKSHRQIRTVYVTPQGEPFTQRKAQELAKEEELVILCGHYEGIDERVLEETVTDYVSIGDYVLTGGELAAMVIVDAVARLVPGVLGNETSADTESFHGDLLEYPQYSRPEVWHGKAVPEVLLTGNHGRISQWRLEQSVARTRERRPDLYARYERKERVIGRLLKHKRDNIHITEPLVRGYGEILYEDGEDILVYDGRCALAMMTVTDREKGEALLDLVPAGTVSVQLSQEFMIPVLKERLSMHVDMQCVNACYTAGVQLPVRHKDIRPLTVEDADYVSEHYAYGSRAYIEERIRSGAMFGAFVDGTLAGFVGEHEEGSLGMLFVHPDCRGQGIGQALEAFMINRHLALGYTPYGQIVAGNEPSCRLQERSGLYLSKGFVWWMSVGHKWQSENGKREC